MLAVDVLQSPGDSASGDLGGWAPACHVKGAKALHATAAESGSALFLLHTPILPV